MPDWPGPAHGYKVGEQKSYIGVHSTNQAPPKKVKIEVDESFAHHRDDKGKYICHTPKFSFGVGAGALYDSEKRPLPLHLRSNKRSPGPGYYESTSCISTRHRAGESLQDSTWAKVAGGSFIDIPKSNPGPAHYSPGRTIDDLHKPRSAEPGFAFQMGYKDSTAAVVRRNRNPGPGAHEHIGMNPRTFNRTLKGELEPRVPDDKSVPIVDNRVPGPGAYDPDDGLPVPNFKICQKSPRTKQW